jgi:hypothetical protein
VKELCRCATECEWLQEHYKLEHHPNCPVVNQPAVGDDALQLAPLIALATESNLKLYKQIRRLDSISPSEVVRKGIERIEDIPTPELPLIPVKFDDRPTFQRSIPLTSPANYGNESSQDDQNRCSYNRHIANPELNEFQKLQFKTVHHTYEDCLSRSGDFTFFEEEESCLLTVEDLHPFMHLVDIFLDEKRITDLCVHRCDPLMDYAVILEVVPGTKNLLIDDPTTPSGHQEKQLNGKIELRVQDQYLDHVQQLGETPNSVISALMEHGRRKK